jgi:hypothetical protein
MASDKPPRSRRRRWVRYSLRTFLILMTAVCLALGMYVKRVLDQKVASEIVRGWGGTVWLDYRYQAEIANSGTANQIPVQPPQFRALRKRLGDDYFSNVVAVSFPYHLSAVIEVDVLCGFKKLRVLTLSGTKVNDDDLRKLARLHTIETLHLADTDVTDDGIQWLIKLPRLKTLSLRGTVLTDVGLRTLAVRSSLEELDIVNTNATEEGLAQLIKALPNCHVTSSRPATRKPLKWNNLQAK